MKNRIFRLTLLLSSTVLILISLRAAKAMTLHNSVTGDVIGYSQETGMVTFVGSRSRSGIQLEGTTAPEMMPADMAQAVLAQYAPFFGEENPDQNLRLISTNQPVHNQISHRYQQTYKNIPIIGAELILNLTDQGGMLSISGELSPDLDLPVNPALSPEQALQIITNLFTSSYHVGPDNMVFSTPELWIYDPRLLTPGDRPPELVWRIETSITGQPVRELVLINAHTGKVSLHFNQIGTFRENTLSRNTTTRFDPSLLINDILTSISISDGYSLEDSTQLADPAFSNSQTLVTSRLEILGGGDQAAQLYAPFPQRLSVIAYDQYDDPLPGVHITYSAPDTGGSTASFGYLGPNQIAITTNEAGIAEAPQVFANQSAGTFTISAEEPESGITLTFGLENLDGPYWYVSTDGDDTTNDCRSPDSACASIGGPFSKSDFQEGDTILVASGWYTGSGEYVVLIEQDVNIRGGWNADFTEQTGTSTIDGQTLRNGIGSSYLLPREYNLFLENLTIINAGPPEYASANLLLYYSNGAVENCIFSDGSGHGVNLYGSDISFHKVQILNNSDNGLKFSFRYHSSHIELNQSVVADNQLAGIRATDSELRLENTTISENGDLSEFGGGIYFWNSDETQSLSINNTTITNNQADHGAGVFAHGISYIQNSILANNHNPAGFPSNCWGELISTGYNLVGSLNGCDFIPLANDQIDSSLQLVSLGDFGGSTLTHPILAGSSAVDAASPLSPGSSEFSCASSDQRGQPRPFDGDGDSVARCDIGAYEYTGPEEIPTAVFPVTDASIIFRTNESFPDAFQSIVLGPNGGEVPGIEVTFSAPLTGPSGLFDGNPQITVVTDGNGLASSGAFSTNELIGSYQVAVQVVGLDQAFVFEVRNLSANLSTYDMQHHNDDYLPGEYLCDERIFPCTGGYLTDADHAHQYALDVYEFYLAQHGRDSLDGNGGEIISSVHYSFSYLDSFWNGSQVVYGDGDDYPLADDIVAHELTHGVTEYSSGLFNYYQSGAIRESFSDLWGEAFDQTNAVGLDAPEFDWLLGESLSAGAIRSMKDPTVFNHPDKITSPFYHLGDLENLNEIPFDNGGVHTNSGVNNKAVFLMVAGDSFNGQIIHGIGWDKVLAIYYQVQTTLLTSGSDYGDLYFAVQQACSNLIGGEEGITEDDCIQVENALDAVEMDHQPAEGFNPDATLCPENSNPDFLFYDSFEAGIAQWQFGSNSVTGSSWGLAGGYASDGSQMIEFSDQGGVSSVWAGPISSIQIPTAGQTYLAFNHSFAFNYLSNADNDRTYLDGGLVQIKIADQNWMDLGPFADSGAGYNGTVSAQSDSPLSGQSAYIADSHGYVGTRIDLSEFEGQTVRFRWLAGTDSSIAHAAWQLDQVSVYTCLPVTPAFGPDNINASDGLFNNHILVSWDPVESADSYQIYRDTESSGLNVVQIGSSASYSYSDYAVDDLQIYYFWISACNLSGCSPLSGPDGGYADAIVTGYLFEDDFESGDLLSWTRYNDGNGFLYTCEEAAINGGYGACVERGDNDKRKQLIDDTPINQTSFNARFSFDINNLSMATGERFRFMQFKMVQERPAFIVLKYQSGKYWIQLITKIDDLSKLKTGWYQLTDTVHTIEVAWQQSSGADDGYARLYIDEILQEELGGLDNDTIYITSFRMGFTSRLVGKSISGIFYIDNVATSSTGYIGLP